MQDEALQQFRTTINMPAVAALRLYYSGMEIKSSYDNLKLSGLREGDPVHGKTMLCEKLPIINTFMDMTTTKSAYVNLRGPKNFSFHLDLHYLDFGNRKDFSARLSSRHRMNYPKHCPVYNEWQEKLRKLLNELDL
ncbi:MAG: hypothetical protein V1887_03915 [Candidatus Aenigmatarchaeota archaeon]